MSSPVTAKSASAGFSLARLQSAARWDGLAEEGANVGLARAKPRAVVGISLRGKFS
jgi:hypothetical protein